MCESCIGIYQDAEGRRASLPPRRLQADLDRQARRPARARRARQDRRSLSAVLRELREGDRRPRGSPDPLQDRELRRGPGPGPRQAQLAAGVRPEPKAEETIEDKGAQNRRRLRRRRGRRRARTGDARGSIGRQYRGAGQRGRGAGQRERRQVGRQAGTQQEEAAPRDPAARAPLPGLQRLPQGQEDDGDPVQAVRGRPSTGRPRASCRHTSAPGPSPRCAARASATRSRPPRTPSARRLRAPPRPPSRARSGRRARARGAGRRGTRRRAAPEPTLSRLAPTRRRAASLDRPRKRTFAEPARPKPAPTPAGRRRSARLSTGRWPARAPADSRRAADPASGSRAASTQAISATSTARGVPSVIRRSRRRACRGRSRRRRGRRPRGCRPTAMPQPSSSRTSRASAASGCSPGSTLPPGNSHRFGIAWSARRRDIRTRPSPRRTSAATTSLRVRAAASVSSSRGRRAFGRRRRRARAAARPMRVDQRQQVLDAERLLDDRRDRLLEEPPRVARERAAGHEDEPVGQRRVALRDRGVDSSIPDISGIWRSHRTTSKAASLSSTRSASGPPSAVVELVRVAQHAAVGLEQQRLVVDGQDAAARRSARRRVGHRRRDAGARGSRRREGAPGRWRPRPAGCRRRSRRPALRTIPSEIGRPRPGPHPARLGREERLEDARQRPRRAMPGPLSDTSTTTSGAVVEAAHRARGCAWPPPRPAPARRSR